MFFLRQKIWQRFLGVIHCHHDPWELPVLQRGVRQGLEFQTTPGGSEG